MNREQITVVTGGAGFIGSNLVWELNRMGEDRILIVDSLGSGEKWKNIAGLKFRDYLEKDEFLRRVEGGGFGTGLKTVLHLGACSSTTESDVGYLVENNYRYTVVLAEQCLRSGTRFVYASSAATYGNGSLGYSDAEAGLERLRPLNAYGFSKQMVDLWAWRHGFLDRMAGLKYFNVFGPNEYHKGAMRSMVCKGFRQIKDTGKIRLFASDRPEYGDGEQERDFISVGDAARMTLFFLERPDVNGIFNVGSGETHTWNEMAAAIFEALDIPPCIEYIPLPEELKGRYQYHTRAEMAKLREAGYALSLTPFRDAVVSYVRDYLIADGYLSSTD
ncbi:MAG TPA: ADP-glyceromanno-heptose 6-epimerase [bacterium]|nr:ADP-glyceromanno-heptose 6-epimerase [bacterium]HPJ71902.1 ADP-glyceromanno-heptose 6-epimerase [bacterium]